MPITKKKSTFFGVTGAGGYAAPNSALRAGVIHRVQVTADHAADDLTGSTIEIADVSSSAVLCPESTIDLSGINVASVDIGAAGATNGLLDGVTAAGGSAGVHTPIAAFGAKWGMPIWQQLGLAADPMQPMTLVLTLMANASNTGTAKFDLHFANHV